VTLRGRTNAKTREREGRREAQASASPRLLRNRDSAIRDSGFFASGRGVVALRQHAEALSGASEGTFAFRFRVYAPSR
jgi:hypothetical protein